MMDFQTEPFYATMERHDAINMLNAHRDELAAKHGVRSLSLFVATAFAAPGFWLVILVRRNVRR